ncbi:hypothetical protein BCR42DRAFT_401525 [Absidia repens]|uniref:Ubiquitin-like domain-containing protein n=1 Tax=Absidia repens TaxID=90262 RepID=A0A1X2J2L5_9FUNG|nr:hypothetical protein BCR42DRAFT_401525 [Absidia repens]
MGCCLSSQSEQGRAVTGVGKPFKRNNIQWTSDIPITRARLQEQRNTFWETAPFYEGRSEIWQAIQAAMTTDDIILAQSILDAANIKLPTGNPAEGCYDELGNRYEIPLYCLVDPTNVLPDAEEETDIGHGAIQSICSQNEVQPCGESSFMTQQRHTAVVSSTLSSPSSSSEQGNTRAGGGGHQKTISSVSSIMETPMSLSTPMVLTANGGGHISSSATTLADASTIPGDHDIIVRLSSGKDIPIKISSTYETVPLLKSRIYADTNVHLTPDTHQLRLIYLGKILDDHTSIISDFTLTSTPPLEKNTVKLRAGAVIQALVITINT